MSKGQLRGSCWCSIKTIYKHQLDQKIMRACISYTHHYPNKCLNSLYPYNICKIGIRAKMQVTSMSWSKIKSSTNQSTRFRLNWIKRGTCTKANVFRTGPCTWIWDKGSQDSPLEEVGGGWRHWAAGRPPWLADQPMGPTASTLPRGYSSLAHNGSFGRLSCWRSLCCPWLPSINMSGG